MPLEVSRSSINQGRHRSQYSLPKMRVLLFSPYRIAMFFAVTVILTSDLYEEIKEHVIKTQELYETGGLLLGYKAGKLYFIVAATFPSKVQNPSRGSFILDGDFHGRYAQTLMERFWYPPSILGIWHSHIDGIDTFSYQDHLSNKKIAASLNGTLSMLVTLSKTTKELNLKTSYITAKGKAYDSKVIRLHCILPSLNVFKES